MIVVWFEDFGDSGSLNCHVATKLIQP